MISGEGIHPLKEKVDLASYYRKFIAHLSNIVRPFTEMTKKNTSFVWSPFDTINIALTNSPILNFPHPNQPCLLYIDTSKNNTEQ